MRCDIIIRKGGQSMYILMNKNNVVATFEKKPATAFSDEVFFYEVERMGKLPLGFEDINVWIDSRKSSKHNAHLQKLMRQMGCDDNEGFIRTTHAATINDTFWIKSDNESLTWEQISLYSNQFTETISRLAFEGVGLYAADFSSTSPELACEGSFRKCFRKEEQCGSFDSDIFIYKRGNEYGPGLEPYCEMLASEIAAIISPENYVPYRTVLLHDKLASKCNLFTNEQYGYASFSKLMKAKRLQDVFDYFENIGASQAFREMLVVDSLCFNQDRHAGNYGVLFDNETLKIIGMAPVFDLNLSMLPYVSMSDFDNIGDKLFEYAPVLGDDFTRIGQMAMNDTLRDRVKTICDFSFAFRGDDIFTPERIKALEAVVRKQAEALLSTEVLRTRDVFFSQNAVEDDQFKDEVMQAVGRFHIFVDAVDHMDLGDNVFKSECVSSDTVQLIFEMNSYELTVDFLKRKIMIADDRLKAIEPDALQEVDSAVYELYDKLNSLFTNINQY